MPELPEVETVVRGLRRWVTGLSVESVLVARPDMVHGAPMPLSAALRGRRIRRIHRLGKLIRIEFDGGRLVCVHLGMSGRLTVADRDAPVEPHTHLRIAFRRRRGELRFRDPRRFGGIWLVNGSSPGAGDWIGRPLPPAGADALGLSVGSLQRLLVGRRRRIKALLIDQRAIGGLGNIYVDEALYRARIHPAARACDLDAGTVRHLGQAIRRVLAEAIAAGGSTIGEYRTADNTPGWFQHRHRVYARAGRPCPRCRTPVQRLIIAGRSTFICPRCQRLPTRP